MEITKEINTGFDKKTDMESLTLSAPGIIIGATVSAIVFTTLNTSGEILASGISNGIEISGNILVYGTELTAGTIAANTVRTLSRTYGTLSRPAISNSSRLAALGISAVAGTGAAFTTSALVYGGKHIGSYLHSLYEAGVDNCKNKFATMIQYPVNTATDIIIVDDDIQLIDVDNPKCIFNENGVKLFDITHSQQDASAYSQ